jgi:hypothetical protein
MHPQIALCSEGHPGERLGSLTPGEASWRAIGAGGVARLLGEDAGAELPDVAGEGKKRWPK